MQVPTCRHVDVHEGREDLVRRVVLSLLIVALIALLLPPGALALSYDNKERA